MLLQVPPQEGRKEKKEYRIRNKKSGSYVKYFKISYFLFCVLDFPSSIFNFPFFIIN